MSSRSCGTCRECCIHVGVVALNKPPGVPCEHLLTVLQDCGACSIYDQRPSECQAYECSWLQGLLPEELKPELSGLLFETATIGWPKEVKMLMGFEHKPGSLEKYREVIRKSIVRGVVVGIVDINHGAGEMMGHQSDVLAFNTWLAVCQQQGELVVQCKDQTIHFSREG